MAQWLMAILMGVLIGILTSLFGAMMSYFLYLRSSKERSFGPLGILLIIIGVLGLIGLVVLSISLFVGQITLAILTGLGVLIGFTFTFGIWYAVFLRDTFHKF